MESWPVHGAWKKKTRTKPTPADNLRVSVTLARRAHGGPLWAAGYPFLYLNFILPHKIQTSGGRHGRDLITIVVHEARGID